MGDIYKLGGILVGIAAFIGTFIYALDEWGLLLGLMFGWIPAIIGALIIGFLWPLFALIIGFFIITGA